MPGECIGTLIGAFELTDPTDCLLKCEGSEGCTWFTHHTREEFCALYSEIEGINVQRCPSCVSGKNKKPAKLMQHFFRFGEDTFEMYLRYRYMRGCIFCIF